jgi:uncharacterized protein YdgA (DUF945 family)
MKKAAIAAVLLVLALLALPGITGWLTESAVRQRVAAIDASPAVSATITSFDRGWFRSSAQIDLRFAPDNVPQLAGVASGLGPLAVLPIVVEFAHGPVAVLDGVHFGWSKIVARPDGAGPGITELTRTLGVPYVFEFRGRTSYVGTLSFDADAPPFILPVDEALLMFSGGTLAGTFAKGHLVANAQVGSVDFSSPTGTFALRGLYASADNELRSRYVMPGSASLSIDNVSLVDGIRSATPMFEAANLKFASTVSLDASGELLEVRAAYDLDTLRAADTLITAAALGMTLRNLDVAALEAYSAMVSDAAAAGTAPDAIVAALGPHLERALQKAPSLTVDPLRFRYDDEPFEGRIEITTNPDRLPKAGTLTLDNPLLLVSLVNTDANVRVSKALATKLARLAAQMQIGNDGTVPPDQLEYMAEAQSGLLLTMLVGQGVLLEDGDGYRSSLQFTDGTLTLNGNPLPFGL